MVTCVRCKGYHPLTCSRCLKELKLWISEQKRKRP